MFSKRLRSVPSPNFNSMLSNTQWPWACPGPLLPKGLLPKGFVVQGLVVPGLCYPKVCCPRSLSVLSNVFFARLIMQDIARTVALNSCQVPIFDERECRANVEENGENFSEGLLCAGGNKKGSCQVFPFAHRYEIWFSKHVWVLYSHTTPNDCTNSIVGWQWRTFDCKWGFGWPGESRSVG